MKKLQLLSILVFIFANTFAQPKGFEEISLVKYTSPKNQLQTGTCWDFATTSFIESEFLKNDTNDINLSESFTVYYAYINRAEIYIRMQGHHQFGQGGQAHDALDVYKKYGAVPDDVYPFVLANHNNLEKELTAYADSIIKLDEIPLNWQDGYKKILNRNLGTPPETFEYEGKTYTPKSFVSDYLKIDVNNYIELTSFNHHDFDKPFVLEVPDNWAMKLYYNVHIAELISIIDNALAQGYSVDWDGDVSDDGFKVRKGLAVDVDKDNKMMNMTADAYRLQLFNEQKTTDDHLMHLVGSYKNAKGEKFYLIKNSWGKYGPYKGFLYMSEDFLKYHTIAIMVNKNALSEDIADRLNIK